ncbi:SusC/RagA family TonB-linked outer membrane protein [Arachidicoccus terrestris]|uniref:SusC/RagA family TonB-linked outer membrane protein n=1 Tax=Arachidicoccus terrestris TaxID=2875539 RepID=UPI001CC502BB|nr:TonB-dependent receptor [Arachidicoccus terrestris]UAY55512.1 TonB-dependent receptor [Arachidicoccus terrestris]
MEQKNNKGTCFFERLPDLIKTKICYLLLAAILPLSGWAQIVLKGQVSDPSGAALPGVSVKLKGGVLGTTTDTRGQFTLELQQARDTLRLFTVSYVGFKPKEVLLSAAAENNITLIAETGSLDEVIVVGYGTQKKVNLTGAVDQVGSEVFEDRPMTNITRGLQGAMPNLNIRMTDGKPTRGADYNIRGTTSIGAGGSALILIDGVPGDPDMLNPNDIESVSILKDASSAAIYGSRGAFGVILITTKSARNGKTQLNFSSSLTYSKPTIRPEFITDGYTWAKNFDSAYYAYYDYKSHPAKANSVFPVSLDYLDELKKRHDDPSLPKIEIDPTTGKYVYYGSSDWQDLLYADANPSTEQSLSASGGTDKAGYYLSGRYNYQHGIFRYNPDKYKMYNFRTKGFVKPFKWLKLANNLEYSRMTYHYPLINHSDPTTPIWRRISDEFFPVAMLFNPDGSLTRNASITLGGFVEGNNYSDQITNKIYNSSSFDANFLGNHLHFHGDLTVGYTTYLETRLYVPVPYGTSPTEFGEQGDSRMNERNNRTDYLGTNLYGEYDRQFGGHYFKLLLGYNYEHSKLKRRYYQRYDLINPDLPDFSLIDGQDFTLTGGGEEWTTLGGFFRFNYNYNQRYLLEFNGRYDGSSKFPHDQQYGFFPSASAGWRISQEPFWQVSKNFISDLKLRASYGTLGNGNVDPYSYQETMSVGKLGMILNGINPNATQKPNIIPNSLTWEKSTTANFGADVSFIKNHLTASFDWYTRYTTDMFTVGLPLPGVFGASVPKGNYADLKTRGWELNINWQDNIGNGPKPLHYAVHFILSDHVSYITKYNNPLGLINTYYKGMRVGDIWGYVNEGYFTSAEDIASHADQTLIYVSSANQPLPGDIKFKDLNGDGVISPGSGTLTDPGDKKIIGNTQARYPFGLNLSTDWNNFFFSVFFQGVGKRNWWPSSDASLFWGQYNRPYSWEPVDVYNNQWTPENPDAYFPRLRGYVALNSGKELKEMQSKYVQNVAYIRLKNLSLGYKLPHALISKWGMSMLKVYVTGQNLWVWSPMYKHVKTLDPEVIEGADPEYNKKAGDGMDYPMLKSITVGINVTF